MYWNEMNQQRIEKCLREYRIFVTATRGSMTIFVMLIMPVILVSIFIILSAVQKENKTAKAVTLVSQASEVRMSHYSKHTYDTYRLLVYENDTLLDEMMKNVFTNNKIPSEYHYEIELKQLSDPLFFKKAIIQSAKAEIPKEILEECLATFQDYEGMQRLKARYDDVENFKREWFDRLNVPEYTRFLKAFNVADSDDFDEKVYETYIILKNNLKSVKEIYEGASQSSQDLGEFVELTQDIASTILELDRFLIEIDSGMSSLTGISKDIRNAEDQIKSLKARKSDLNMSLKADSEAQDLLNNVKVDVTKIQNEIFEIEANLENAYNLLETLKNTFLLDYTEVDKIVKTIEPYLSGNANSSTITKRLEQLTHKSPSLNVSDVNMEGLDYGEVPILNFGDTDLPDKVLIIEYILGIFKSNDLDTARNFDFAMNKSNRTLGEVEFILSGGPTQKARIQNVLLKIFAMRNISNNISILKDSKSMSWIRSISAPLSMPYKYIIQGFIVLAWSGAESYYDVDALKKGEGIALFKPMSKFKLNFAQNLNEVKVGSIVDSIEKSIEKISDDQLVQEVAAPQRPKSDKGVKESEGLFYQDYLRLLLMLQPLDVTLSRTYAIVNLDEGGELSAFSIGHKIEVFNEAQRILRLDKTYD